MNLILTMAGNYSRFLNLGYKIPKFLLPWGSKTILSEILSEMSPKFDNVFLIVNKKDSKFFPHIYLTMKQYSIPQQNLIIIDSTDSQSETALKGLDSIGDMDGPLVIHNIDTILYSRDYVEMSNKLRDGDGFIDVFTSNNQNYSYIIDENGCVTDINEKIIISDYASSGLYGFKNKETYVKYYESGYISSIYKSMITDGLTVNRGSVYNEVNTVVLGTPEEYLNLSNTLLLH